MHEDLDLILNATKKQSKMKIKQTPGRMGLKKENSRL
jgi:hypothetical protein